VIRRWALPVVLTVITVVAATAALRPVSERDSAPPQPAVRAAVLSPRRVPRLLADAVATAHLHAALDRVLRDPELGAGRDDSCLVVSRAGEILYDQRADRALTPASTFKLLTAAAALRKLGPDSHMTTRAVAVAAPRDGVLAGDLFLVGGGDPLLGTADYEASFKDQPRLFTDLAQLADDITKAGVRAIDGRVLGDESRFDTQRYVPTWKPIYAIDGDVGPLSALTVNDGLVQWKPKAVPTPVPAGHAAALLTDLLRARGVTVAGEPGEGTAPRGTTTVASLPSLPLKQLVGEMLIHSDNESAELLTKELGHRFGKSGTTAAGVDVIRATLTADGLDLRGVVASDGSGLDPADKVSCRLLHALLTGPEKAVRDAGLSVAGRTGTMFDRFKGNPAADRLRAKTGTLEGVVGLVGLIDPLGAKGPPLDFAFLANSLPRPSESRGKRMQERLGAALATYPDAPTPESLAP
jgi:D-alanyl-D-alanine carboxypeptidase/D-alanyl-D-alanine-endopeptidase (penicillin-binding protein 4)